MIALNRSLMCCATALLLFHGTPVYGGDMNLGARLTPAPGEARFEDKDYYIWGGSMVRGPEGKYHLLYSRWPRSKGFKAWVTHSEIAHAVSDEPTGPYRHVDVALPERDAKLWDGLCTHNPTVHVFGGTYYLYYMGNTGDRKSTRGLNWTHRNNQRIGVAVADHPGGPWKRFDNPLIDVGTDKRAHDALMTSNPSICRRPDGTYLLVYKCVAKRNKPPAYGPVVHMVATSDSPTGPFVKHPDPVFTAAKDAFPAEDPYIWQQGGTYWAVVKDMRGSLTGKKCLGLFESRDGFAWKLAKHPIVTTPQVKWADGGVKKVTRLERPQLWLDNGVPAVLFCAAMDGDRTYNVHIPLTRAGNASVSTDLVTPAMTTQEPGPGRRVRQVAPEYAGTDVYHALYLPTDWKPGGTYPVIVEYTGNKFPTSGSSGEIKDANLGYGMSGGTGFIWVCMPYVEKGRKKNAVTWWGDTQATVEYCKVNLPRICKEFGGDPDNVFICGFSRGAIGASYIGLADDEIATLWKGMFTHDHFDGERTWGYPKSDRASALVRLARLKGRPVLVCGMDASRARDGYLKDHMDLARFTFLDVPTSKIFKIPEDKVIHPHTDLWMHRESEYRSRARAWLAGVLSEGR
jgi:hypothetical protein